MQRGMNEIASGTEEKESYPGGDAPLRLIADLLSRWSLDEPVGCLSYTAT